MLQSLNIESFWRQSGPITQLSPGSRLNSVQATSQAAQNPVEVGDCADLPDSSYPSWMWSIWETGLSSLISTKTLQPHTLLNPDPPELHPKDPTKLEVVTSSASQLGPNPANRSSLLYATV